MQYPIDIIQGAFYGSEGKGMVAGAMAMQTRYAFAVRTGAINAGHTVYHKGKPYAMQQLPVAWVNPDTALVIGPGAYVHLPTLVREIDMVNAAMPEHNVCDRLYIDSRVGVHLDSYADESKAANRHHKIGATGKGCAEAIIHKIKDRGDENRLLIDYVELHYSGPDLPEWNWVDVPTMLTKAWAKGARIMLEGTQGELLDFHLGPWPYGPSRQTIAAAWVAEAGLSPSLSYAITLVARSYPIRVAGNSGPLPHEITWSMLASEINSKLDSAGVWQHPLRVSYEAIKEWDRAVVYVGNSVGQGSALLNHHVQTPEWRERYKGLLSDYAPRAMEMVGPANEAELRKLFEFTTVTKKLRRVARLDMSVLNGVIDNVRPKDVVLTFFNYDYPLLHLQDSLFGVNIPGVADGVTIGPDHGHLIWDHRR